MAKTKPQPVTDVVPLAAAPKFDAAVANYETGALARHAMVRAVAAKVGYELSDGVDADLIQRDIQANMRRSVPRGSPGKGEPSGW